MKSADTVCDTIRIEKSHSNAQTSTYTYNSYGNVVSVSTTFTSNNEQQSTSVVYTYDLTYTWNDIIDPNFEYDSDKRKYSFANKLPFANPTDYYICISWHDKSIINVNGKIIK